MRRIRRILHPSDFSTASRAAFAKAVEMATTNRARLLMVHVLPSIVPMASDGYMSPEVFEGLKASVRADGRKRPGARCWLRPRRAAWAPGACYWRECRTRRSSAWPGRSGWT
jgi:nucleotide-binding universal stress UspA family protein